MDLKMLTEPPALYAVLAIAAVILAALVWGVTTARAHRDRNQLRERYGEEFDRAVAEYGSRRAAVADLRAREAEHDQLSLRNLNDADLALVRRHMAAAQYRFVEDPADALLRVERVMTEVLRAKGYPVAHDRHQAARLFSVDHPDRAGSVRSVLDDGSDGDLADLRKRFLEARKTIADVTGTTYVLDDANAVPADLRIEHAIDARSTASPPTAPPR